MPDNPYQPPGAPIDTFDPQSGSGTFDIMQCVSEAWAGTWATFPTWLGVFVVGGLLFLASGATVIGIPLVWPLLGFGFVRFYLNSHDRKESFSDLFSGFSDYGSVLVGGLILFGLLFVISLVGQVVQIVGQLSGSGLLAGVGTLVALGWAYVLMPRLYFAAFLWVDRGLTPVEAIQESWELTRANWLKTVGLLLAGVVVVVLGLLALVIGVFPASNMLYLMWASAYRQMVGEPVRSASVPIGSPSDPTRSPSDPTRSPSDPTRSQPA